MENKPESNETSNQYDQQWDFEKILKDLKGMTSDSIATLKPFQNHQRTLVIKVFENIEKAVDSPAGLILALRLEQKATELAELDSAQDTIENNEIVSGFHAIRLESLRSR